MPEHTLKCHYHHHPVMGKVRDYLTEDEKLAAKSNQRIALAILVAGAIVSFLGGWISYVGIGIAGVALGYALGNDGAFRKIDQLRAAKAAKAEEAKPQ